MSSTIPTTIGRGFRIGRKKIPGSRALLFLLLALLPSAGCRQSPNLAGLPPPPTLAHNDARASAQASTTKTHAEIGFATRQKFLDHYDKHGAEFGSISKEEYLRQAQALRDRPAGGDILEVTRADGVVTRFDKRSGAFLAFNRNLTIRTFFKPNDGERYFRRQSRRPAGNSERE